MKERTAITTTVPPVPSAKMDGRTLNAAMDAGTSQTTSKRGEGGAKYFGFSNCAHLSVS